MAYPVKSRSRDQVRRDGGTDASALIHAIRERGPDAAAVLTVGWTRRHLIDVALELAARKAPAQPVAAPAGSQPQRYDWTPEDLARAHITYGYGNRSPWACEGERIHRQQTRQDAAS